MSDASRELARSMYPRVSQVLKDLSLTKPYPEGILAVEWGRARGSAVHKAIEFYEWGVLDATSLHPDVAGPFAGYLAFKHDTQYKPEAFEEQVFHDALRFRGTLDSRGVWLASDTGPKTVLIDFKCSKSPDLIAASYQLSAYAMALENMNPKDIPGELHLLPRYVVQLGDESYRVHDVTSDKARRIFEAACEIWHAQREGLGT